MLTIYRRHKHNCTHRSEGRAYRRCLCPIWVDGTVGGVEVRKSLGLRDWQRAQEQVRKLEAENKLPESGPVSIAEAWKHFIADAKSRNLSEATIYKYTLLQRQITAFAEAQGFASLSQLDVDLLSRFRSEWKDGPNAAGKKLERLRAFLGFCRDRKWIDENPAKKLKAPKFKQRPALPFTHTEVTSILAAVEKYGQRAAHNARLNAVRLRAMILLLRYSGMRLGDAVSLTPDRIKDNRLFLYTAKTGTPVNVLLPEFVTATLNATPPVNDRYYFWTGIGKLHTAVKVWETRLRRVFILAGLPDGHAHRFRDTFAVEMLLAGKPIERVSAALGHQDVRITQKHYAPWIRARQQQLEDDLRDVWARDPLVLMETKGTQKVHGENEAVN